MDNVIELNVTKEELKQIVDSGEVKASVPGSDMFKHLYSAEFIERNRSTVIDPLIKALRCSSTVGHDFDCTKCAYCVTDYIKKDSKLYDHILEDELLEDGTKVFRSCDNERMALEAAEILEQLDEMRQGDEDDGR